MVNVTSARSSFQCCTISSYFLLSGLTKPHGYTASGALQDFLLLGLTKLYRCTASGCFGNKDVAYVLSNPDCRAIALKRSLLRINLASISAQYSFLCLPDHFLLLGCL